MNLVDSCGWLEYFADTIYADNFERAIENSNNLIVPTICITEVFKKILKEKNEDSAIKAIAKMQQGLVVDLDSNIATAAAKYGHEYNLPLADSIVYATGKKYNALIYTEDSDFINLPGVKYFSK